MDDITASDLLHAMVRQAPGGTPSVRAGLALDGYTAAFYARVSPSQALTMPLEYQKGFFCCNQGPLVLSERAAELLALQSIMIDLIKGAS
jgi:hypothetical protein